MKRSIQEILSRYGQMVMIHLSEGDVETKAFLQPVTSRNEQMPEEMTGIGSVDGRLWLYLGQTAVDAGDRLVWNGTEFRVRSSRPYQIGETVLYWWAVLERAKEAAE